MTFTEERAVEYSVKEVIENMPADVSVAMCKFLRVDKLTDSRVRVMYNGSSDVLTFFTLKSEV